MINCFNHKQWLLNIFTYYIFFLIYPWTKIFNSIHIVVYLNNHYWYLKSSYIWYTNIFFETIRNLKIGMRSDFWIGMRSDSRSWQGKSQSSLWESNQIYLKSLASLGVLLFFFPYPAPLLRVFIETNGVLFLLPPKKFHPRHDTQKTKITSTYRSKTSPICREEEDWLPAQACDLMLKHFRQSPTQINGCQKTPVGRLFLDRKSVV